MHVGDFQAPSCSTASTARTRVVIAHNSYSRNKVPTATAATTHCLMHRPILKALRAMIHQEKK